MIVALLMLRLAVGLSMPLAQETTLAEATQIGPTLEVGQNPLGGGTAVTLQDAQERWPGPLPVPPTNARTGLLAGIWSGHSQIAFGWWSEMRFYVSEASLSKEEYVRIWTQKAAEEPRQSRLVMVRGHVAIAHPGNMTNGSPSAITWIERGLSLQFVAPNHTLRQVMSFAEAIRFER